MALHIHNSDREDEWPGIIATKNKLLTANAGLRLFIEGARGIPEGDRLGGLLPARVIPCDRRSIYYVLNSKQWKHT